MTYCDRYRQTSSLQRLVCCYFVFVSLFWAGSDLSAQEEASVEEQLRRLIPSATAVDREAFEKIARSPETPKRSLFNNSLTTELMFLDPKTIQGSDCEFQHLTEGNIPKPTEFAREMYRSIGGGRFRIVTHPVTMIQAERITKLDADVNGKKATGAFQFHVPELYEGKADFTAEKTGGEWRFTRFGMPKLKIDIRADESGQWWRTEDLNGFELPKCLNGHTGTVWSLDFSKDGTRLVSGSNDGSVRIWNVAERKTVRTISPAHKPSPAAPSIGGVLSVCFSPDEERIATAGDDGTAKIWDAQTGEKQLEIHVKNIVDQAIYTPDGESLVVASGELTVWDISREQSFTIEGLSFPTIALSPDENTIVSTDQESNGEANREQREHLLKLFDITSGREFAASSKGHKFLVTDLKFSFDGKRIASCSRDKTIKIWDAANLRLVKSIQGHEEALQSIDWSPDGRWIVGGDTGGGVKVWNAASGELHESLPKHPQGIRCVRFSPDGQWIATAGHDGVIRLWAAPRGAE